jgi:hypothetical protein
VASLEPACGPARQAGVSCSPTRDSGEQWSPVRPLVARGAVGKLCAYCVCKCVPKSPCWGGCGGCGGKELGGGGVLRHNLSVLVVCFFVCVCVREGLS